MESCVTAKLNKLGFQINTAPYAYIEACNSWYQNELIDDFHKRISVNGEPYEIDRMNFAKRGCSDDANLCEIIDIHVGTESQSEEINEILKNNRFDVMYRKQLERMSAAGTVAAYVRLDDANYLDNGRITGGTVKLSWCYAENYIPLHVDNDEVTEAAFWGNDYTKEGKRTTLVVFTLTNGLYKAETYVFDKTGREAESYWVQLGDIKPFEVMKVAEVNNIDNMNGFGLPKIWNAIPILKKLDLCNMVLHGDLEKGEKFVLTNEAVVEIDKKTGQPKKKSPMWKRLFVFLGKKPIDGNGYIQEYTPKIRIEEITKTFELCLSLFSMMFGFGSKKYTFENGQIQTATEYIGERQDAMQELNRQRKEAADYIAHLIKAVMWFSNTFCQTAYDLDADICIDFDDSYIEDKSAEIQSKRDDAISFSDIPEFMIQYIMLRLNVERKEAVKIYNTREPDDEPEPLD